MLMTKTAAGCGIVGLLMLAPNAFAATVPLDGFMDLWGTPAASKTVKSLTFDSLMIDNGGTIESVGLDGTGWHIGFVDYIDGVTHIVGYARNAAKVSSGYEGWMYGQYAYDMNFDEDLKPDDVIIVQDMLSDGIGVLDEGNWIPGSDDVLYTTDDVLFGPDQTRGDISQLPAYGESRYLPQMTVSAVPDTIIGDLDGDGFVGITDLNLVLSNWNLNVPPADGAADPSGDGFVGIEDLNTVLGNWNAGTPPGGSPVPEPTCGMLLAMSVFGLMRRRVG